MQYWIDFVGQPYQLRATIKLISCMTVLIGCSVRLYLLLFVDNIVIIVNITIVIIVVIGGSPCQFLASSEQKFVVSRVT